MPLQALPKISSRTPAEADNVYLHAEGNVQQQLVNGAGRSTRYALSSLVNTCIVACKSAAISTNLCLKHSKPQMG